MSTKTKKRSVAQGPRAPRVPAGQRTFVPTGLACPACGKGEIVPTVGRYGPIWVCSERIECRFWLRARPTGHLCPERRGRKACGALMMEGTKTIPERCSDKQCPNHMPHL